MKMAAEAFPSEDKKLFITVISRAKGF